MAGRFELQECLFIILGVRQYQCLHHFIPFLLHKCNLILHEWLVVQFVDHGHQHFDLFLLECFEFLLHFFHDWKCVLLLFVWLHPLLPESVEYQTNIGGGVLPFGFIQLFHVGPLGFVTRPWLFPTPQFGFLLIPNFFLVLFFLTLVFIFTDSNINWCFVKLILDCTF